MNARNKRRPSIYLSPPLAQVAENLGPNQSLSGRLATMAERYHLAISQAPELTDDERSMLGDTLTGTLIEPLLIKWLELEVTDGESGTAAARAALADRIRQMSYAERIAMIEELGF